MKRPTTASRPACHDRRSRALTWPRAGNVALVEPIGRACRSSGPKRPITRLSWLAEVFGLAPFELDIVLIALAPEVDLRYERIYAYLQDDVTRRRPSVDLVLNLLCSSAEERLARRACLSSESPLVRHRLIRLIPDPQQVEAPLLAHYIKLDEQIVRLPVRARHRCAAAIVLRMGRAGVGLHKQASPAGDRDRDSPPGHQRPAGGRAATALLPGA